MYMQHYIKLLITYDLIQYLGLYGNTGQKLIVWSVVSITCRST